MIVKKLNDVSGGGFPGARYNEKKIADGVATLMAMENVSEALRHNVETLHRFGLDASAEVERYLKENSKTYGNTKTTRFQFHVSASVKGRAMSPEELTDFARELMDLSTMSFWRGWAMPVSRILFTPIMIPATIMCIFSRRE